MRLNIDVVDAFTETQFKGNPAAVVITDSPLDEVLMQSIALENNLSETAFLYPIDGSRFHIRWFSPMTEIAFCGHATLASAFVLFERNSHAEELHFFAKAVGDFSVRKNASGTIQMDFPNNKPIEVTDVPDNLLNGLSISPAEVYKNSQAYFAVYDSEADVLAIERNNQMLAKLKPLDVVATAKAESNDFDFVSRYFWPANGGDEDPVTGSIHTGLAPFWAERLDKDKLIAYQASQRGGVLYCEIDGDRVRISGNAVKYLSGDISV